MGGMVLETNMNEIVAQVEVQNRMEKSEVSACFFFFFSACTGCNLCMFSPINAVDHRFIPDL